MIEWIPGFVILFKVPSGPSEKFLYHCSRATHRKVFQDDIQFFLASERDSISNTFFLISQKLLTTFLQIAKRGPQFLLFLPQDTGKPLAKA
jgi:hypothetical protein